MTLLDSNGYSTLHLPPRLMQQIGMQSRLGRHTDTDGHNTSPLAKLGASKLCGMQHNAAQAVHVLVVCSLVLRAY